MELAGFSAGNVADPFYLQLGLGAEFLHQGRVQARFVIIADRTTTHDSHAESVHRFLNKLVLGNPIRGRENNLNVLIDSSILLTVVHEDQATA